VGRRGGRRLRCIVQDENQGAAGSCASRGQVHRRAACHDYMLPTSAPDLFAVWRFKARFPGDRVPRLWAWVSVAWRGHTWSENGSIC